MCVKLVLDYVHERNARVSGGASSSPKDFDCRFVLFVQRVVTKSGDFADRGAGRTFYLKLFGELAFTFKATL
jgi:hypothetical protein